MALFFCVSFIIVPTHRVFSNISQMLIKVLSVADDVVIGGSLPNILFVFFVAKPIECRDEFRKRTVRSLNICRDRRPRLSVLLHKQ